MHWSLIYLALVPAALLFLFAALMALAGFRRMAAGSATRRWPSAPGRVTRSGVAIEHTTDGESTYEVYQPEVLYTYDVGGEIRTGDALHIHPRTFSSRDAAEREASRYAEGAEVRVFYHPADPSRAVLEPGAGRSPAGYFAMAVLLAVAGLYAARLMCGANAQVAAGLPSICGAVPSWVALPW
ncbi:MAG TPA: DUF3592 domain-containing protein [Longimicrobium sp.]|uniref:DUF3592 domain-containing protein n=1 Tax=Longimicrobium sp. TaxID=2029185 RepID=UPI002ED79F65